MTRAIMFYFQGRQGRVFPEGYVVWGGCGFQIEAALPALRQAIDKAIQEAS